MAKDNVKNIIEVVVLIFGAFGSFFLNVLPEPIEHKELIYGLTQVFCVIVFLFIRYLVVRFGAHTKRFWIVSTAIGFMFGIWASIVYVRHHDDHYRNIGDSGHYIITGDLSDWARTQCERQSLKDNDCKGLDCDECILSISTVHSVAGYWVPDSKGENTDLFRLYYILMAVSLSATIFALVEAVGYKEPS